MPKHPVRTEGPMSLNQMPTEKLKVEIAELKEKLEQITKERDRFFNDCEELETKFHERGAEIERLKEIIGRQEADSAELAQLKMEGRIRGRHVHE